MGRGTWYKKWQDNLIFQTGSNLLNENSFVFSFYPRTNQYGFQDGKLRSILLADMYSRFLRLKGNNVLFPVGFHSLGASSILEERKSGTDEEAISDLFYNQLVELGVSINEEKLIDMKEDTFLRLLQQAFIDLYEKGYILYKNKTIYYDEKNNKIYQDFTKKSLKKINQKCLLLDIKKEKDNIIKTINSLAIDKKYKKEMMDFLNPTEIFYINLYLTNKETLKIKMLEPENIAGISYIFLNPDYININKYITADEKDNIMDFLNNPSDEFIFSGSMAINPLTGEKIPVCISRFYKEAIYLGIPSKDEEDLAIASGYGFKVTDIIADGVFINSDFLNGLDQKTAHETIIESFADAEIGELKLEYINDEINLFSFDNYGPLFPFLENNDRLIPIKDHLPFKFSNQYRNASFRSVDGQALGGTINNMFIEGMLPYISIVYDKFLDFNSFFSNDAKNLFTKWLPIDLLIVDEKNIISEVLMPIIFFEIFKNYFKFNIHHLFNNIKIIPKTVDIKQNDIKRSNNNLIDFDHVLDKYYSDSIRYFFMINPLDEEFIFNPYVLADINKYVKMVKETLLNITFSSDKEEDIYYRDFKLDVIEKLRLIDISSYIKLVVDFTDKHILTRSSITKSQLLKYLLLISPVFPYLAEEIYEIKFQSKYSIYNEGI